jgi:hypothetical protein
MNARRSPILWSLVATHVLVAGMATLATALLVLRHGPDIESNPLPWAALRLAGLPGLALFETTATTALLGLAVWMDRYVPRMTRWILATTLFVRALDAALDVLAVLLSR